MLFLFLHVWPPLSCAEVKLKFIHHAADRAHRNGHTATRMFGFSHFSPICDVTSCWNVASCWSLTLCSLNAVSCFILLSHANTHSQGGFSRRRVSSHYYVVELLWPSSCGLEDGWVEWAPERDRVTQTIPYTHSSFSLLFLCSSFSRSTLFPYLTSPLFSSPSFFFPLSPPHLYSCPALMKGHLYRVRYSRWSSDSIAPPNAIQSRLWA